MVQDLREYEMGLDADAGQTVTATVMAMKMNDVNRRARVLDRCDEIPDGEGRRSNRKMSSFPIWIQLFSIETLASSRSRHCALETFS
jgi:hypothetical protein